MRIQSKCIALSPVKILYRKVVLLRCFASPVATKLRIKSKLPSTKRVGWRDIPQGRGLVVPLRTEA